MSPLDFTRREFVSTTSKAAAGAMIVPSHVLGQAVGRRAPSDTLNVAIVGAGGMGGENARRLGSENIVAVCDIDHVLVAKNVEDNLTRRDEPHEEGHRWKEQYERAAKYSHFEVMLDESPEIDAVVIATPDHAHAVIAKACMEAGKHVYVQKPLTWSVQEARLLSKLAAETGVVTQMGNQGHSSDDARRINEWIQAGIIGDVTEVHVWTNRPIWPQGIARPAPLPEDFDRLSPDRSWWPGTTNMAIAAGLYEDFQLPDHVAWDLFLGPIAKDVKYHPIYHPFHWRGWVDFGVGALGDMGAHLIDHPFWALDLDLPSTVECTSTPWGGPSDDPDSYPVAMTVHYEFPAKGSRPAVDMHWYDGGLMPQRHPMLPAEVKLDRGGGVMMVGEHGILMHETYGSNPKIYPEALMEDAAAVPESMIRIADEHHEMNWANACMGNGEATCPFSYAAPLTETMLLGLVALRAGQGEKIHYDAENMAVTSHPHADEFLTREYREGWGI